MIGRPSQLLANDVFEIIVNNAAEIEAEIDHSRDFSYDFFGFKTIERAYLLKVYGKVVERPYYMLMRVSIGIFDR